MLFADSLPVSSSQVQGFQHLMDSFKDVDPYADLPIVQTLRRSLVIEATKRVSAELSLEECECVFGIYSESYREDLKSAKDECSELRMRNQMLEEKILELSGERDQLKSMMKDFQRENTALRDAYNMARTYVRSVREKRDAAIGELNALKATRAAAEPPVANSATFSPCVPSGTPRSPEPQPQSASESVAAEEVQPPQNHSPAIAASPPWARILAGFGLEPTT